MKRLLALWVLFELVILMLRLPAPAPAQILSPIAFGLNVSAGGATSALISSTCQGLGTNGGTTSAINTTGANFIAISSTSFITIPNTDVSDSKSNGNPTALTSSAGSGSGSTPVQRIFYWTNPTVGSGHTFTIGTSGSFSSVCVEAWSNMATSSVFDSGGTLTDTTAGMGGGTTCDQGSSVVPTSGAKVLISGISYNTTGAPTIDSGLTVDANVLIGGASNYASGIASIRQSNGSSIRPIWTTGASAGNCNIAVFKGN